MKIKEAIKILASSEEQYKFKNLNLLEEYTYLVKWGSKESKKKLIKDAVKLERKLKLQKINEKRR